MSLHRLRRAPEGGFCFSLTNLAWERRNESLPRIWEKQTLADEMKRLYPGLSIKAIRRAIDNTSAISVEELLTEALRYERR